MNYLLDTNTIIGLIEGRPPVVRATVRKRTSSEDAILIPSIAVFELWYGAAKSRDRERNEAEIALFLSVKTQVVAFDIEDAKIAGEVRAHLAKQGTPIGPYDVLIAAQALRRDAVLVTANVREFSRVPDLAFEDWTLPDPG